MKVLRTVWSTFEIQYQVLREYRLYLSLWRHYNQLSPQGINVLLSLSHFNYVFINLYQNSVSHLRFNEILNWINIIFFLPIGQILGLLDMNSQFKFKRKIRTWTGIWTSDLQISSLALYHLSYPGLIDGTGLNLPLEMNAIQALWSVTLSVTIWPT